MNAFSGLLLELVVHTILLGVYVVLRASPQIADSPLMTILGFVILGTTFALMQRLLSARLAPPQRSLDATGEGRRELLWRASNHKTRLLELPGWPSWTLNLYRYATFVLGVAAVLAAVIYIAQYSEALTFAVVPVIAGVIALAASLPLLVARTVFERWGVAHPEKVTELLMTPEARDAVRSASS